MARSGRVVIAAAEAIGVALSARPSRAGIARRADISGGGGGNVGGGDV